jgi:hypothetical protein
LQTVATPIDLAAPIITSLLFVASFMVIIITIIKIIETVQIATNLLARTREAIALYKKDAQITNSGNASSITAKSTLYLLKICLQ